LKDELKMDKVRLLIYPLAICLLAACAPSAQDIQAAIAQTQAALPTIAITNTPEPTSTATPEIITQAPGGPGRYVLESSGTVVQVDVPAPLSDKDVNEIETLRKKTNAAIVSYLLVSIDNNQGQKTYDLGRIIIVTEEGEQVEYRPAWGAIGDWMLTVDSSNIDLLNECVNLYNGFLGKDRVLPGAVTRTVFIAPQAFTSVKSVWADNLRLVKSE